MLASCLPETEALLGTLQQCFHGAGQFSDVAGLYQKTVFALAELFWNAVQPGCNNRPSTGQSLENNQRKSIAAHCRMNQHVQGPNEGGNFIREWDHTCHTLQTQRGDLLPQLAVHRAASNEGKAGVREPVAQVRGGFQEFKLAFPTRKVERSHHTKHNVVLAPAILLA